MPFSCLGYSSRRCCVDSYRWCRNHRYGPRDLGCRCDFCRATPVARAVTAAGGPTAGWFDEGVSVVGTTVGLSRIITGARLLSAAASRLKGSAISERGWVARPSGLTLLAMPSVVPRDSLSLSRYSDFTWLAMVSCKRKTRDEWVLRWPVLSCLLRTRCMRTVFLFLVR